MCNPTLKTKFALPPSTQKIASKSSLGYSGSQYFYLTIRIWNNREDKTACTGIRSRANNFVRSDGRLFLFFCRIALVPVVMVKMDTMGPPEGTEETVKMAKMVLR